MKKIKQTRLQNSTHSLKCCVDDRVVFHVNEIAPESKKVFKKFKKLKSIANIWQNIFREINKNEIVYTRKFDHNLHLGP
jgi:hypothetical protein